MCLENNLRQKNTAKQKQANLVSEKQEESFFYEAMQFVAAEEGRKAIEENERLKNDPDFVVPETLKQKLIEILSVI